MPKPLHEYLRKLAQEIEDDERGEREAEHAKKLEEIEARALSDDDRSTLDRARKLLDELDKKPEPEAEPKPVRKAEEKPPPAGEEKPKGRTRPGRKKGMAYAWWVDEHGQTYKLDGGRIYQGDDEPDEVEIPEPPAAEESEAGGEAA